MRRFLFPLLFFGILAADFFFKSYIFHTIRPFPYGGIPIFQSPIGIDFSLEHVANQGAAWGVFSSYQSYLHYFRVGVIVLMGIYALFFNRIKSRALPFLLIIAGALGNVIDYFRFGAVIDMFHFCFWGNDFPTFNIADSAIFMGVCLLLFERKRKKEEAASV